MNEGLKINNYDKFNNKYKITDINNFKIASTYENMTNLLFGFDVMAQALTVGLFGSTKSLLSYSSNKDEIIQTLQSMELLLFSRPEIERFLTKDGFDYSGFLNYGMITGKFTDKDLAALDNYVYVRELKSNLDEILHNFLSALTGIALFIKDKGIKSLNLTSYYLISFLVRYICKDVHYRVAYKNILCQLSEYIAAIDTLVMDSKKQDTVSYKGVNIQLSL